MLEIYSEEPANGTRQFIGFAGSPEEALELIMDDVDERLQARPQQATHWTVWSDEAGAVDLAWNDEGGFFDASNHR